MQRLIAGLILAIVCASLHAQTLNLRATIPFAFRAGETVMPSGECTIRHSDRTLFLHKERGRALSCAFHERRFRRNPPAESRLNFSRYGERYFLSSVWTQASEAGCEIPKSRPEKELARQNVLRESVGIALQRQ